MSKVAGCLERRYTAHTVKHARTVLIILAVVAGLGLTTGLLVSVLGGAVIAGLNSPATFSPSAMTRHETSQIFGITLVDETEVHSRDIGFQDPELEFFARLPDVASFLKRNDFTVGTAVTEHYKIDAAMSAIDTLRPHHSTVSIMELEGVLSSPVPDGGMDPDWNRSGLLLKADGESWVYLLSFGT